MRARRRARRIGMRAMRLCPANAVTNKWEFAAVCSALQHHSVDQGQHQRRAQQQHGKQRFGTHRFLQRVGRTTCARGEYVHSNRGTGKSHACDLRALETWPCASALRRGQRGALQRNSATFAICRRLVDTILTVRCSVRRRTRPRRRHPRRRIGRGKAVVQRVVELVVVVPFLPPGFFV